MASFTNTVKSLFSGSSANGEASSSGANYGATSSSAATPAAEAPKVSKIEPKVWLASERTYLNWLRVSILISTFSLTLYNSAPKQDMVAKGMGIVYGLLGLGMMAYSWWKFRERGQRIGTRYGGDMDDLWGPLVVSVALFVAVLINFVLRVTQRERLAGTPTPKNPWKVPHHAVVTTYEMVVEAAQKILSSEQ